MNDDGGSRAILVRAASFTWLAMLAFDFLLHGGCAVLTIVLQSTDLAPATINREDGSAQTCLLE